jgi:succinate dehydrogenase/fumarate reductase flavoprotein subunit
LDINEENYVEKYTELIDEYSPMRGKIGTLLKEGKDLYIDIREGTKEEQDRIWWALGHEGKSGVFKNHLTKRGVDWRTVKYPLRLSGRGGSPIPSGIWVKAATTETEVDNLYASGNEPGGYWIAIPVAGGALVHGFISGEEAAERAAGIPAPQADCEAVAAEIIRQSETVLGEKNGATWQQAERAVQTLIENGLGRPYTEKSVSNLLSILRREKSELKISAQNPHELSRALEVIDLYDLAELTLVSVLERKSSVGPFVRADEDAFPAEKYGDSIAVTYEGETIKVSRVSNLGYENLVKKS